VIKALVIFGAGYIVGTRAGRERYAQIVSLSQKLADRLEEHANLRSGGARSFAARVNRQPAYRAYSSGRSA
jgi:hypothetical protein